MLSANNAPGQRLGQRDVQCRLCLVGLCLLGPARRTVDRSEDFLDENKQRLFIQSPITARESATITLLGT